MITFSFSSSVLIVISLKSLILLKEVFADTTKEEAKNRLGKVVYFLKWKKKNNVWIWFKESVEETLAVLNLPVEHRKKMKSTNMLEKFNQELKRCSQVVRIFPPHDRECAQEYIQMI